jgi:hypothetical protein
MNPVAERHASGAADRQIAPMLCGQERLAPQAPSSKHRPDGAPEAFAGMRLHNGVKPVGAAVARVSWVGRRREV